MGLVPTCQEAPSGVKIAEKRLQGTESGVVRDVSTRPICQKWQLGMAFHEGPALG
jgi:hypothetical protein